MLKTWFDKIIAHSVAHCFNRVLKIVAQSVERPPLNKLCGHEQSFPSHPLPIFASRQRMMTMMTMMIIITRCALLISWCIVSLGRLFINGKHASTYWIQLCPHKNWSVGFHFWLRSHLRKTKIWAPRKWEEQVVKKYPTADSCSGGCQMFYRTRCTCMIHKHKYA